MDVVALRRQGWTITQTVESVGRHRQTGAAWLAAGGPPERRVVTGTLLGERWGRQVAELLEANPRLLATSLHRLLAARAVRCRIRR